MNAVALNVVNEVADARDMWGAMTAPGDNKLAGVEAKSGREVKRTRETIGCDPGIVKERWVTGEASRIAVGRR